MITPRDELFGHASAAPIHQVQVRDTPHSVFTERFWYMGTVKPAGDMVFALGMGYYPNRRVMDGFAGITIGNVQYNYRASRRVGEGDLAIEAGALRIEVQAGLRMHRIVLAANESGIEMDLSFIGTMDINEEGRETITTRAGVIADLNRYAQCGRYEGWIRVNGNRIDLTPATCWGARDRSWGLRVEARTDETTPPVTHISPLLYAFFCAQFETRAIHFFLKEKAPGAYRFIAGSESGPFGEGAPCAQVLSVAHELTWHDDPLGQSLKSGSFTVGFADGRSKTLQVRALPGRFFHKGGLYGGLRGWFQGDDKGMQYAEHDRYDLACAADRTVLRTAGEQVIEIRDGDQVGYGTLQCGVSAGYPKYSSIQQHPAM
ncbi:hypothetical protein SRS16P2_00187 (plasmid) [Variovorax sp. SRS16]|uniref:hypothetical protein n=1 Tax=Variovorax sp. SRS16 TaxID=282217 RepID=UPI00131908D5|nr:hypothetical protein [Variovorax sp. SRS16]VTU45515.1 hypothetical protein SRS16P2_00187 [Variovorax sp. SRS16]